MTLPRGTGFRGFRESVCNPRPGRVPHGAIRRTCVQHTYLRFKYGRHIHSPYRGEKKKKRALAKRLQLLAAKQEDESAGSSSGSAAGGWQTWRRVCEQMGSLLHRQSSQRILPDESCLLRRAEFRVNQREDTATGRRLQTPAAQVRTTARNRRSPLMFNQQINSTPLQSARHTNTLLTTYPPRFYYC